MTHCIARHGPGRRRAPRWRHADTASRAKPPARRAAARMLIFPCATERSRRRARRRHILRVSFSACAAESPLDSYVGLHLRAGRPPSRARRARQLSRRGVTSLPRARPSPTSPARVVGVSSSPQAIPCRQIPPELAAVPLTLSLYLIPRRCPSAESGLSKQFRPRARLRNTSLRPSAAASEDILRASPPLFLGTILYRVSYRAVMTFHFYSYFIFFSTFSLLNAAILSHEQPSFHCHRLFQLTAHASDIKPPDTTFSVEAGFRPLYLLAAFSLYRVIIPLSRPIKLAILAA